MVIDIVSILTRILKKYQMSRLFLAVSLNVITLGRDNEKEGEEFVRHSRHIQKYRNEMTHAAAQNEEMEYLVAVAHFFVQSVEEHADRVE